MNNDTSLTIKAALAFIDAINSDDPEKIIQLITEDHKFIDSHGNEFSGKKNMLDIWKAYFELFPDYKINIGQIFEKGFEVAMFGLAAEPIQKN